MENNKLISILETVLFVSGEPVKKSKLAKITDASASEVDLVLSKLSERYIQNGSGLMLLEKGEEVQLVSIRKTPSTAKN
jgi:segregation and condensation protein B